MIFALNLFFSVICSFSFSRFYKVGKNKKFFIYCLFLFPIWFTWLIICGGQDGVGTDYESYYKIFSNPDTTLFTYYYKQEYLFAWIVELINYIELPPQTGFFIFYLIGFLVILKIATKLHHNTFFIFILLFLAYSTAFNNQLNGLRQYIALYWGTLGIMLLYEKKGIVKFIICIIIACLFHSSSLLFLPFLFFIFYKKNITYKFYILFLTTSVLFSLLGSYDWIWKQFDFLIPANYMHYMGGDFDTGHGFTKMITKLIFIPFYIYSLNLIKYNKLTGYDLYLFKIGFISYCIRLFFMDNIILNRIGVSLILISIFPIYYLLRELYLRKSFGKFHLICLFFVAFYLAKVILFPTEEYLYNSIYKL